jgi:pyruvate/2-oxoglutarate dehydrogenase complex dihydrolipoamide acyltransferase (E2) component
LETEKVNYELDSPAEGVMLKIPLKEDAKVSWGIEVLSQELRGKPLEELTTEAFKTPMDHVRV